MNGGAAAHRTKEIAGNMSAHRLVRTSYFKIHSLWGMTKLFQGPLRLLLQPRLRTSQRWLKVTIAVIFGPRTEGDRDTGTEELI